MRKEGIKNYLSRHYVSTVLLASAVAGGAYGADGLYQRHDAASDGRLNTYSDLSSAIDTIRNVSEKLKTQQITDAQILLEGQVIEIKSSEGYESMESRHQSADTQFNRGGMIVLSAGMLGLFSLITETMELSPFPQIKRRKPVEDV